MKLSNSGADSQGCQFQDFATDLVLFHSFLSFLPTSPRFHLYYLVEESIKNWEQKIGQRNYVVLMLAVISFTFPRVSFLPVVITEPVSVVSMSHVICCYSTQVTNEKWETNTVLPARMNHHSLAGGVDCLLQFMHALEDGITPKGSYSPQLLSHDQYQRVERALWNNTIKFCTEISLPIELRC